MLKIDRNAFLALALGMSVGGCYVAAPPPQQPGYYPRASAPPPGGMDPMAAPQEECVGWTQAGECNEWAQPGDTAAPQDECVNWTPTGECNRWEPNRE